MGDQEFERYLALLSGMLKLSRRQRESIASELRDHLEERLAELRSAGVDEEQAVREALEEFGDMASLANEFAGVAGALRRRSIMRYTVGSMGLIGTAAVLLLTFWPASPIVREVVAQAPAAAASQAAPGGDADDDRSGEVYRELAKSISIAAKEEPLDELLSKLAAQWKLDIQVNKKSLEDQGVDPATPVTLELAKVSAETILKMLLAPHDLTFVVDQGVIEVLTKTSAEERLVTRVYGVADLTAGDTVRQGVFGAGAQNSVVKVLTDVVGPQTWADVGGRGTIQAFQGMLIISQTEAVHREITPLLDELRRVSQLTPGREGSQSASPLSQVLAKRVQWKVQDMPLREFVELIRKELGIAVLINRTALNDEGLDDAAETVTLGPGQFTAQNAIDRALRAHGMTSVIVRGELLQITTLVKAEELIDVQLFNVRDLLTRPGVDAADDSDYDYDALVELVTSTVSPQSWDEAGGRGSIQGFRGMLVVAQTAHLHAGVAELLGRVRAARERQKAPLPSPNPDELELKLYGISQDFFALPPSVVVEGGANVKGADGKEPTKELLLIVQQLIEPKSWQSAGGKGQVFLLPDTQGLSLVVKQTPAVHKEVRQLLRTIEREIERKKQGGRVFGG